MPFVEYVAKQLEVAAVVTASNLAPSQDFDEPLSMTWSLSSAGLASQTCQRGKTRAIRGRRLW